MQIEEEANSAEERVTMGKVRPPPPPPKHCSHTLEECRREFVRRDSNNELKSCAQMLMKRFWFEVSRSLELPQLQPGNFTLVFKKKCRDDLFILLC